MSNQYSVADVAKHKDESNGMWIIVDSGVYDITSEHHLPISYITAQNNPADTSQTFSTSTQVAPRS